VLDRNWPDNITSQFKFGEIGAKKISVRLQLNKRDTVRRFRECPIEMTVPERMKHLKSPLNTRPISSSEYERVLSGMNLIVSQTGSFVDDKNNFPHYLFLK
jgi:hypothetical protein